MAEREPPESAHPSTLVLCATHRSHVQINAVRVACESAATPVLEMSEEVTAEAIAAHLQRAASFMQRHVMTQWEGEHEPTAEITGHRLVSGLRIPEHSELLEEASFVLRRTDVRLRFYVADGCLWSQSMTSRAADAATSVLHTQCVRFASHDEELEDALAVQARACYAVDGFFALPSISIGPVHACDATRPGVRGLPRLIIDIEVCLKSSVMGCLPTLLTDLSCRRLLAVLQRHWRCAHSTSRQ